MPPSGPQILIHEGARQTLERRLELAASGPVQLAVTDNRRRMITHTQVRGTLRVRIHMMFLGAPDRIQQALVSEARALIAAMPVSATQASAREMTGAFTGGKEKGARQSELEQQWAAFAKERYAQAKAKAEDALKLAK